MKYQSLILIASCVRVLAWVVVAIGVIISTWLGYIATTIPTAIGFWLVGFVVTAIFTLMLLAISRFIYLFVDIQKDLSEIAGAIKKETKD